jgi:hypothetical protein
MTTKIQTIKTDHLIPYARNSRTHNEAQVAQIAGSIKEFGFTNPVLVDDFNTIIAGHGRVMAAKKLGLEEVPVIVLSHLTDTQRQAYVIADNKIALNAGWDEEMLKLEVKDLAEAKYDFNLIGMSEVEFEMYSKATDAEAQENDDAEPIDNSETNVRQIIINYPLEQYVDIIEKMANYAEQFALSNNTEVLSHLLETNGYEINQRQED